MPTEEPGKRAELSASPADGRLVPLDGRGEPADRSRRAEVVRRASGLTELAGGLFSGLSPRAVVRALPDVVKVTGALVWRTNQWTISASMHIGDVMIRGAVSGQSASSLIEQLSAEAKQSLRELLGVSEVPDPMPQA